MFTIINKAATLFKKRLWHACFPENFAKLLRTLLTEHLQTTTSKEPEEALLRATIRISSK